MTRWPTEHHFTSWLTLAPHNKISGGRLLDSRTPRSANRAAAILRLAATSLARTQTALGAFYRRLAFRVGAPKAVTATARKLAILVYRTLKDHLVTTRGPTLTMPSTGPASSAAYGSAPRRSDWDSSICPPASSSMQQFLRRPTRGCRPGMPGRTPHPELTLPASVLRYSCEADTRLSPDRAPSRPTDVSRAPGRGVPS